MTRNLKLLTIFGLLWSAGFFAILDSLLQSPAQNGGLIAIAAAIYGLGYGLVGLVLGMRDSDRKSRLNLSQWYANVAMGTSLFVGGLWIAYYRPSELDTLGWMVLIFGAIIATTYFTTRKNVKGMSKEELFK